MNILGKIRYRLVQIWRARKARIGWHGVFLGSHLAFRNRKDGIIEIGNRSRVEDHTSFCFNKIDESLPVIRIGRNVSIGKWNDFGCSKLIEIGDDVTTAPYVHFTDRNHGYEDVTVPIIHQKSWVKGPIRIGRGSWIGFGAQIMSGVSVGRHCVVGAGAVVTRDVPDFCVVGGNPARLLKKYNVQSGEWERI